MTFRRTRVALAVAVFASLAVPIGASASSTMLTGIADENVLNNALPNGTDVPSAVPGGQDETVAKWKASGVQDVRMFAQWNKLVPAAILQKRKMPEGFDPTDPASYDFSGLDAKIDLVRKHDMGITLVVTGAGPVWGSQEPARGNGLYKPDPAKFGQFAAAVAKHVAERVDRYIIWNEPNLATWLRPQWGCTSADNCTPASPHQYRLLAEAGYTAIHDNDPVARVAIGGTSSKGTEYVTGANTTSQPLSFLRAMACVNSKYKPIKTGSCKVFKPLSAEALSYHPHSLQNSPGKKDPVANNARMADLPRLTAVIDKLAKAGRIKVKGASKLPLWLDEYAYETNPPDTTGGTVSLTTAASWSQWGWSVAARNPRVQLLTQYEWFDETTKTGDDAGGNRWQSGLFFIDGKPKPLAAVFDRPIFGWRTAKSASVWGQARPGNTKLKIRLQRKSGSGFRDYKTVTTNGNGMFQVRVPQSSSARYRFVFTDPVSGQEQTSATTSLRKL
jgi:hypothetical protein